MIKEYTLSECVEKVIDYRGKTPSKLGGDWSNDGFRVISALNVHNGEIDNLDQIRCVSDAIYNSWMKEDIHRYDCFLASEGASLGENAIWDSDEKVVLGQRLYAIRTNPEVLDPWYFAAYMQTKKFRQQVDQVSTGSTVFGISQPVLLSLKLILPDIEEQRKVGCLYKNLKRKIELNNSICGDIEAMAKQLYDYWFVQFDFPDENGKPYKSSGGKMVWNEELKREIPEGWKVWALGEHMTSSRGVSYSSPELSGEGIPMLNLANFNPNDTYNVDGIKYYSGQYTSDKVLKPYDLIMCNTQQTALDPQKDIIGHCLLVPDIFTEPIVSSHHVNHLIFDIEQLNYLVYGESKTAWFHKYMSGLSSGTNILGIDFSGVYKYKMVLPNPETLEKYANNIYNLEARKNAIIVENKELTQLHDFLLPMLMNGQVKIKEKEDN